MYKTAHTKKKLHVKAHYYCTRKTKITHKNRLCMSFAAINARGRTPSNTNKQTIPPKININTIQTFTYKMATVCEVRTLLFLKDVVFNKRKSIFIKVSFYRRVASRSRRRLYSIVRSFFCCERKVVPGKRHIPQEEVT